MKVSREQVRHIASLARLRLTSSEEEELSGQLTKILDYVEKLEELDVEGVPPMSHVLDIYNVLRVDTPQRRISRFEALSNAPDADATYFRVPKVID